MNGSRVSRTVPTLAAAVALAGCGIHDPYNTTTTSATPSTSATVTRPPASLTSATRQPASTPQHVRAGAPGSAHWTAYRFALTYARVSAASARGRVDRLISLATPAYAESLRRRAAQAEVEAARGLPRGGRMMARIVSLQLGPPQEDFDHGVVILSLGLAKANGRVEPAFTSRYIIDLLRAGHAWRVADFSAAP